MQSFREAGNCSRILCNVRMPSAKWKLSGLENSTASYTRTGGNGDDSCLVAASAIRQGPVKHTISLRLEGIRYNCGFRCGVVRDGTPCAEAPIPRGTEATTTTAWLMNSGTGRVVGNGKVFCDCAGRINSGQVLTMQVDLDAPAPTVLGRRQATWPWLD